MMIDNQTNDNINGQEENANSNHSIGQKESPKITPSMLMNHFDYLSDEFQNPFPYEVFPKAIQQIVTETNRCLIFPIDFIGSAILYAASVAAGNCYKVGLKDSWTESAMLYMTFVARPGTNKSHPLNWVLRPIIELDKRTYKEYQIAKKEYDRIMKMPKKDKSREGIEDPEKPVWHKFLVTDFTPEALAEVHLFNKRGIGVYVDELASWIKNFNRYTNGSEMEFWLSVWSAKPINIDRKTYDPIFIPNPFISVCGTIQNSVLLELQRSLKSQNGFIDRILFVIPDNLQKEYWSQENLSEIVVDNWERILNRLLELKTRFDETYSPKSTIIEYTTEAKALLFDWQKTNTDLCNSMASEDLGGVYSKFDIYISRLSLLLELLKYGCGESELKEISVHSVEGAIKLIQYFRISAEKVQDLLMDTNPFSRYDKLHREFYEILPTEFFTHDALAFGKEVGISKRVIHRFLADSHLFSKMKRGQYKKVF